MIQLMHSFRGFTAPLDVLERVKRGDIGAFCLFRYNVESVAQVRALTESLYRAAQEGGQLPPLIGIDQEGGQLMAITEGATPLPGNMALGATRSPRLAELAGRVLGTELLAMGINLNFAPSLDINNNPSNPVIGVRSFGDSAELVSELGQALIRGLQSVGVVATAKHFPGHGDTSADSHHDAPIIHKSLADLEAFELVPFKGAIASGVKAVMTAHIQFPALDDVLPATLSRPILGGLLRETLGFEGVIITDAMDMQAVARRGARQSIREALEAGADLVMLGHLEDAFAHHDASQAWRSQASIARIERLRAQLPTTLPYLHVVGSDEHRMIAQEIADHAITVVRDQRGQLPLHLPKEASIAVITTQPSNLTPADTSSDVTIQLADAVRVRHANTNAIELPMFASQADVERVLAQSENANLVIIGTILAEKDPSQAQVVRAIFERRQAVIVVAMRTPYDIVAFPYIESYLCAYSIREVAMEAVARVLFGEILAKGVLPCQIPNVTATL
jgi:beta-N-acetylhexosaminidase